MLDEKQLAAGSQDATQLRDRGRGIVDRAQHEGVSWKCEEHVIAPPQGQRARVGGNVQRVVAGYEPDRLHAGATYERGIDGGQDLVNAERFDKVARDCELVVRQLSRDPYSSFDGQH